MTKIYFQAILAKKVKKFGTFFQKHRAALNKKFSCRGEKNKE